MTWRAVALVLMLSVQVMTLVLMWRTKDHALTWWLVAINVACCLIVIAL